MKSNAIIVTLFFLLFSSGSLLAGDNTQPQARELALKYYQLSNAMQLDEVRALFAPQASISMTWKYGAGYPDDALEATVEELDKVIDEKAIQQSSDMMASYQELTSEEKIIEISEEKGQVVVEAKQTINYKIEDYEGQSEQTDIFFLAEKNGTLKIVEMESVLQF